MTYQKSWMELSDEIYEWEFRNYGKHAEQWQLLLGVVEETGEFLQMGDAGNREGMIDSLGDGAVYLINLCRTIHRVMPDEFMVEWLDVNTNQLMRNIGTVSHGILKNSLGIRKVTTSEVWKRIETFTYVWTAWASKQRYAHSLPPLLEITNIVWRKVSRRDWKANPDTGQIGPVQSDEAGAAGAAVPVVEPIGSDDTEPVDMGSR